MKTNQWEVETWKTSSNVKGPRVSGLVVIDEQGCVAMVSGNPRENLTQMNAALISCAPELLEALESAWMALGGIVNRNQQVQAAMEKAESAILKAKGTK